MAFPRRAARATSLTLEDAQRKAKRFEKLCMRSNDSRTCSRTSTERDPRVAVCDAEGGILLRFICDVVNVEPKEATRARKLKASGYEGGRLPDRYPVACALDAQIETCGVDSSL